MSARARRAQPAALALLLVLGLPVLAPAHVGSPDIFFEGQAGPYRVMVQVQPPDVVPGTARVLVRTDPDAQEVALRPLYFETGREGAARPDHATRVSAALPAFAGQVWLMEFGSASVEVEVRGGRGSGRVVVPVPALATARRGMQRGLGLLLALLGLALVAGALAIVRAGAVDAVGADAPVPGRRGRNVVLFMGALVALSLAAGQRWWGAVDRQYLRHMYRPTPLAPVLRDGVLHLERPTPLAPVARDGVVRLAVGARRWDETQAGGLLPDHGKLMHLFLVRAEPGGDAFAHLHPVESPSGAFDSALPPLPGGRYRVFADVVRADGLAETLTGETLLRAPADGAVARGLPTDPDDSWHAGPVAAGPTQALADGSTMTWEQGGAALTSGALTELRFVVRDAAGRPAALEPYMGMAGHAAVLRDDASVFVHLHPVGTVSMAAQDAFARRMGEASGMQHGALDDSGVVSFPYSFPKPGRYRLWVQVRHAGVVQTGVFDTAVN